MRGITLVQPWAHAVAHQGKRIENRVPTSPCAHVRSVRGQRVAIHAGQKTDNAAPTSVLTPHLDNPVRGALGWWRVPDDVEQRIVEQVGGSGCP